MHEAMRMQFGMVLVVLGCGPVEVERAEPNGFCETDLDCDESDRCVLERERDIHLQQAGALPAVVAVDRCWPRSEAGDWCEADSWCVAGLRCDLADCGGAPCERGLCR